MAVEYIKKPPRGLTSFQMAEQIEVENELELTPAAVNDVAEIFTTPLTGTYNWDYRLQENRIKQLYELGKKLNWNAETDIDWSQSPGTLSHQEREALSGYLGYAPYEALSEEDKIAFIKHQDVWTYSQFLHGEQGALLVASQLTSCAPTFNAKLYAASQTFDEARHVEVFNKYLQTKFGKMFPVDPALKSILDKILSDERWDLKFIGMQVIIEGLALSAFNTIHALAPEGLLKSILHLVIRDEARHVAFGIHYLEEFVKSLSQSERDERAMFAYEACLVSRERLVPTGLFEHWGWDVEESRKVFLNAQVATEFRNLLFKRIIPNLRHIGLITDKVRPLFEQLDILQYENLMDDGDIDWAEMNKPLYQ